MNSASSPSPSEEYQQRLQARELGVARFDQIDRRVGNLRLVVVVAALVAAWFSLERGAFSAWWLLVAVGGFVAIAAYHAGVLRRRTCAMRAVEFYRRGLARMEDRWVGGGAQGERFDVADSLYATDLDLFGRGSLFELLSQARTRMGENMLARWLLGPASVATLKERHEAVGELRGRLDLREDVAVLGEDVKAAVHAEALVAWAESANLLERSWVRWVALLLAAAALGTAVWWGVTGEKVPFFAVVLVEGIVVLRLRGRVQAVLHGAEHALEDLQLLSSLLGRLEREEFATARLKAVRAAMGSHGVAGAKAIRRLGTIVEYIFSLDNPILKALDIPLMYSVQCAFAAEAWRREHGRAVRGWLDGVGEMEALMSLAAYGYERPGDVFPEFMVGEPCFEVEGIGHPLLPVGGCVRNDVRVGGERSVLLISGSNMSGKSTLMRAVGLNTVLAMAGGPVRAKRLQLTPLQVGASILINDSLQEGSSRFYAEITRLRHICDLAEKGLPVLFLLDELLQGTNSKDRLEGAEGVVRTLLERGAIGLISTHDLALTGIGGAAGRLHNVHLQDEIADGRMKFDYKLRDGVVTKSNGIELMRLIGLDV
ncbi:MAG TPA: mismatch repair protein [Edaphobacter sp.]